VRQLFDLVEALRRDPPQAQRQPLLTNISQAASAAMHATHGMLDRPHAQSVEPLEICGFDLKSAIRTIADRCCATAAAKGLALDRYGLDGDPVVVCGDFARLQQLVSILLADAIDAAQAGEVSIRLSPTRSDEDEERWMIIIRGTGSRAGPGLASSIQLLAEAMGGSIAMASDPGNGTISSVELPFKRFAGEPSTTGEAKRRPAPMRILLAEDNPINRRLMAALLIREGHDVVAVEDGRRALGAITAQAFDLVLMDMQMPHLDGISATGAIRALDAPACNIPILAISADSSPERRRVYLEGGIDRFLPKPIVAGQLLDMIASLSGRKAAPTGADGDRFDRERLNLLVEQAGYDDAALVMKMLLADIGERPRRIAAAVGAKLWEIAAAEAEALRTLLSGFGSFSLARLLASIRRQCQCGACPPAIVDEMLEQARALAALLQQELGEPDAAIAQLVTEVAVPQRVRSRRS